MKDLRLGCCKRQPWHSKAACQIVQAKMRDQRPRFQIRRMGECWRPSHQSRSSGQYPWMRSRLGRWGHWSKRQQSYWRHRSQCPCCRSCRWIPLGRWHWGYRHSRPRRLRRHRIERFDSCQTGKHYGVRYNQGWGEDIFTRWLSYICFKLSGRSNAEVTAPRAAIVRRVLGYIVR